jgi:hypothetical protein
MLAAAKESREEVDALVDRMNELIRVDIPALNEILAANDLKPIKAPKEVII